MRVRQVWRDKGRVAQKSLDLGNGNAMLPAIIHQ
jgi:hypothetical protein